MHTYTHTSSYRTEKERAELYIVSQAKVNYTRTFDLSWVTKNKVSTENCQQAKREREQEQAKERLLNVQSLKFQLGDRQQREEESSAI